MKIYGDVHNFVFIAGVNLFIGVVVTGDNKSPVTITGVIYRWC
jgi:hypothetical protein